MMAETTVRMAGLLGVRPDQDANLVEVRFRNFRDNVYCLEVPDAGLGVLIVALQSQASHLATGNAVQPMTLKSIRTIRLDDRRARLELTLEDTVRLPVVFPRAAMSVLRKAADELERLSSAIPGH
jgi:hypothetical protein